MPAVASASVPASASASASAGVVASVASSPISESISIWMLEMQRRCESAWPRGSAQSEHRVPAQAPWSGSGLRLGLGPGPGLGLQCRGKGWSESRVPSSCRPR